MPNDQYTHGHHTSVVGAHATRTIDNSASYLEPYLQPGRSLLDVGCGPGSITAEFAARLAPGEVLGVDLGADVIAAASDQHASSGARFEVMDTYALDLDDDSWDIVHAHQVLQHVSDPVAALSEMRRVVTDDGIVAIRDADYAAMHWAPASPGLDRWLDLYRRVARANDAEPDAGRQLMSWARAAGFSEVTPSVGTWLFADDAGRSWWGSTWSERVEHSSLATQAIERGFASADDLAALAEAWLQWAQEADGWFVVVHGQLLCRP